MKKRHIISSILLIIFILITILLLTKSLTVFDDSIYKVVSSMRCNFCDILFKSFTYLGNTIPVVIIVIFLLILLNKKDRLILGSCVISTLILNQALKHIIRRPRPPIEERLITQGGYSYPSGHSMMALCLYGVLIYFVQTKIKDKKLKIFLTALLTIIILLIGISRIYVRVHYPSDVLSGFILTISILIINITIINNHIRGNINNEDVNK